MSLQEAALSRKEKLAALKKRKELHDDSSADPSPSTTPDVPYVSLSSPALNATDKKERMTIRKEVFRFRNYDPATGGARKHARTEELETVEAQVEGMASRVIAEDELRRAQELVNSSSLSLHFRFFQESNLQVVGMLRC
jgi:coiled-coil domain-containing protein 12